MVVLQLAYLESDYCRIEIISIKTLGYDGTALESDYCRIEIFFSTFEVVR